MLNKLDVGRQVMPSHPTGGWLLVCAALLLGAALIVLVRRSRALLTARALLHRERNIDEVVAGFEDETAAFEEDLEPGASIGAGGAVGPVGRSRQVDLARNNLMLLVRQLAFIDELKAHESDPDTLADLDRLEQLTAQMRRNCASVMVVAGFDPTRTHHRPMPASEVLHQALSGIEQSARVTLSLVADPVVPPQLSAALMHLVAEVIDNATRFSEPTSTVMVLVSHVEDGLRIRVADDGAGIGPEKLAELNELIADPPTGGPADVETIAVRGLGLAAVGRIAQRIDAEVTLSSSIGRGTVASIDLKLQRQDDEPLAEPVDESTEQAEVEAPAFEEPVPSLRDQAEVGRHQQVPVPPAVLEPISAPISVATEVPVAPVVLAPLPPMPPLPAQPVAVPAQRPDEPLENLSGISWLASGFEDTQPTHAAAEAGIKPPAPWDLDDDPNPATALAIDVLPRRKTLLPGKNRPKRDE